MLMVSIRSAFLLAVLCVVGCTPSAETRSPQLVKVPPEQSLNAVVLPGQAGPISDRPKGETLRLTMRRTNDVFPDGNSVWLVELHGEGSLLARWTAASGIAQRQTADRLWSPGNASPLPAGTYQLGTPEPWGDDLWFDLQPHFETTRSALGVHRCYPGTGCICIPNRTDIEALAAWVRASGLREITVSN
jgi:hypothetical protein